jgi:hypothetical protein
MLELTPGAGRAHHPGKEAQKYDPTAIVTRNISSELLYTGCPPVKSVSNCSQGQIIFLAAIKAAYPECHRIIGPSKTNAVIS